MENVLTPHLRRAFAAWMAYRPMLVERNASITRVTLNDLKTTLITADNAPVLGRTLAELARCIHQNDPESPWVPSLCWDAFIVLSLVPIAQPDDMTWVLMHALVPYTAWTAVNYALSLADGSGRDEMLDAACMRLGAYMYSMSKNVEKSMHEEFAFIEKERRSVTPWVYDDIAWNKRPALDTFLVVWEAVVRHAESASGADRTAAFGLAVNMSRFTRILSNGIQIVFDKTLTIVQRISAGTTSTATLRMLHTLNLHTWADPAMCTILAMRTANAYIACGNYAAAKEIYDKPELNHVDNLPLAYVFAVSKRRLFEKCLYPGMAECAARERELARMLGIE